MTSHHNITHLYKEEQHIHDSISNYFQSKSQQKPNPQHNAYFYILVTMFSYLYLVQGFINAIGTTMPYIYKQLPNYQVMSIFTSIALPFSFKFITAPFTQKFNFIMYGKRKTWIIIGQICSGICLFTASFYTNQNDSYILALLLLGGMFFISLQDISLDSLALKQLKTAHLVSAIQLISYTVGMVVGSLILLKLTSFQFAQYLNLKEVISQPSTILKLLSVGMIIPSFFIHYMFQQTVLQSQKQVHKKSILEVLCYYRVFFSLKSKYCRLSIFFLVYYQGFNFFNAGYDYQLIKAGFSRDVNNSLNNIIVIPSTFMACCLSSKIEDFGIFKILFYTMIIIVVVRGYVLTFFPLEVSIVFLINLIVQISYTCQYLVTSIMVNVLPVVGVSGMLLTMLASANNFGQQKGIHTYIISFFGWKICAFVGLLLQIVIILNLSKLYDWIEKGQIPQLDFSQNFTKIQQKFQDIQISTSMMEEPLVDQQKVRLNALNQINYPNNQ